MGFGKKTACNQLYLEMLYMMSSIGGNFLEVLQLALTYTKLNQGITNFSEKIFHILNRFT